MALRVNHNFQADFGHVNLLKTEQSMNRSLERLETGLRINSAKDDAAGLFIADQLKLVSKGLDQGSRNSQDGISAAQIAESTLSQIYDKLTSMYTKASQAATDTNDPNARAALQRDIDSIVDAIDRMAKASEFNGIKLLTGDFSNKKIQYGPRADQSLDISIGSATAKDLGAYTLSGKGSTKTDAANGYASLVADDFKYDDSGDQFYVAGIQVTQNTGAVDAASLAKSINENSDLQKLGIEATASNTSTATTKFTAITSTNDGTEIKIYAGSDTSNAKVSITLNANETLTLDGLVKKINESATNDVITASAKDGKLVLETKNGETLGVEVVNKTGGNIDLGMFLGVASTNVANNSTGSAIKVGKLDVLGVDNYSVVHTGISSTDQGLNLDVASGKDANMKNLTSLNVSDYDNAEMAMKVINVAIKKVDKERGKLGSIQQNLQAIIDNNDFAAAQTREAESRIRNVDFAKEMAEFTRNQTLMQSGISMLAQANQLPQQVLQLLR